MILYQLVAKALKCELEGPAFNESKRLHRGAKISERGAGSSGMSNEQGLSLNRGQASVIALLANA